MATFNNSPTSGVVGQPYLFTWDITSTPVPTTQIMKGTLPPGLTLSNNFGNNNPIISGTPTTRGKYNFKVITFGDSEVIKDFSITVCAHIGDFCYIK